MGLLNFFVTAAAAFGKLVGWLRDQSRQDRERIAAYFDQIADCLQEVAERIENGDAPKDTCRRLAVYANEIQHILEDRHSPIAHSDASLEATRSRLAHEIQGAYGGWGASASRQNQMYKKWAEQARVGTKKNSRRISSRAEIRSLANEIEEELADQIGPHELSQKIWDASGEFRALAHSLRAR